MTARPTAGAPPAARQSRVPAERAPVRVSAPRRECPSTPAGAPEGAGGNVIADAAPDQPPFAVPAMSTMTWTVSPSTPLVSWTE
jgi:hypothetical protein